MGSSPLWVAIATHASVAQLVEQRTENPRVVGSIPTGGTSGRSICRHADLAHLVERRLAKAKVAGSSPVIRSKPADTKAKHSRVRKLIEPKRRKRLVDIVVIPEAGMNDALYGAIAKW